MTMVVGFIEVLRDCFKIFSQLWISILVPKPLFILFLIVVSNHCISACLSPLCKVLESSR